MTHDIHELGRLSEDPTWTGARQVLSELRPELTDVALADVPDPRVGRARPLGLRMRCPGGCVVR